MTTIIDSGPNPPVHMTDIERSAYYGLRAAAAMAHDTAKRAGWYHDPTTGEPIARNFGEVATNKAAAANAIATECLARVNCPADLIDWGRRHGIEHFAQVTWQAGFQAGWQAFFMMQGLSPAPLPDAAQREEEIAP